MLTKDAIEHFGSQAALARALGIKPPSVQDWGAHVPPLRQLQLERITNGQLRADPDVFGQSGPEAACIASAAACPKLPRHQSTGQAVGRAGNGGGVIEFSKGGPAESDERSPASAGSAAPQVPPAAESAASPPPGGAGS